MASTDAAALRTALANKEAEAARLAAEIGRLRQTASVFEDLQASQRQELTELREQLAQLQAASKAQERSALLRAVDSNREPEHVELQRLRSEVDIKSQALSRLEDQLSAISQAHALRLSEMQDTFVGKVQELRRVQQEQLAAAEAAASEAAKAAAAEASELRAKLAAAEAAAAAAVAAKTGGAAAAAPAQKAAEQALQRQVADLQAKLAAAEAGREAAEKGREAAEKGRAAAEAAAAASSKDAADARQRAEAAQRAADAAAADKASALAAAQADSARQVESLQRQLAAASMVAAAPPPLPALDPGMLQMMEAQLGRLSEMLRAKDVEIEQLSTAVQMGIDERRQMMAELTALREAAAAGGRPAGRAPAAGSSGRLAAGRR